MVSKSSIKSNTYVTLGCALSLTAQAQVAPDAGAIQRAQQKPALEVPAPPAPRLKIEEHEYPRPQPASGSLVLTRVHITGNTVFAEPELLALFSSVIGKEVSLDELNEATARITRHYRERGYMVARAYLTRAYLPLPQRKDGIAEIAIIEGRFGKVQTGNRTRVRDSVVRAYTDSLAGSVVRERDLERKLLLLNDLAGVQEARGSLQAGERVGESDLGVELRAAPALSGSVELDNHGNRYTGANRLSLRMDVANPLALGDTLSARVTKGFEGLEYARAAYQLPLGSDGFKLGAAYAASRYRLGKTFAPLAAQGESANYTFNASYPLIRSRRLNLHSQVSYDYSRFQDRVNSTGTLTDKETQVTNLALTGDAHDSSGGVSVFMLNYGHGRLNIETPAARADDERSARTHGHYDKWSLNLLRLQSLSARTSLYLSFAGQKARKNLDSSEKFVLGGANGVRAYPQGEAAGDSGYIAAAELRYTLDMAPLPGVLRPFVFVDGGAVTVNEQPYAAGANHRHLAAAGFGLWWAKARDFQVQLTVATRLGNERVTSETDRRTLGWVQLIKYF